MISDSKLEYAPWGTVIGPGIGGPVPYVPPKNYSVLGPDPHSDWMKISIEGPGYTDMMAYLHRPLMSTFDPDNVPAYISFPFDLMTDLNAPTKAQAIEFECCFCDGKNYCNGSLQINYQQGGELQAWGGPNNQWVNTGINLGILVPMVPYHFKVRYMWNKAKAQLSTLSVAVNDVIHPLPPQFQNIPAIIKDPPWAPGVYCQYQLDLAFAGGAFSIFAKEVDINWE